MFLLNTSILLLIVSAVHTCTGHKDPDTVQPEAPGISHPDADIMTVVVQLNAEIMDMRARYDDMKVHYKGEMGDMKEHYDDIKLHYEGEMQDMKSEIIDMKEHYDGEILKLKEHYDGEILDIKEHYDGEILEMNGHFDGEIQKIKNGHDEDRIKMEERHDADIMNMKERYDDMIQVLTGKYDKITSTQENELTELKERHNELRAHCETEISDIMQHYDDENDNIAEMKQDYNFMKAQYAALIKHNVLGVSSKENLINHVGRDKNNDLEDQDEVNSADLVQETDVQGFAAFQTYLSSPFTGPLDDTIVFDDVRINIGGGYDPLTGHFVAPTNGLYVINRSHLAHSSCGTVESCTKLMVNGVWQSTICSEWVTSTAKTELLQLAAGDDVWLQVTGTCTSFIGSKYESFSGYLLIETL